MILRVLLFFAAILASTLAASNDVSSTINSASPTQLPRPTRVIFYHDVNTANCSLKVVQEEAPMMPVANLGDQPFAFTQNRYIGRSEEVEADIPPTHGIDLHYTPTVDWLVMISGEVDLIQLDGTAYTIRPGDAIVQHGGIHRWSNKGPDIAREPRSLSGQVPLHLSIQEADAQGLFIISTPIKAVKCGDETLNEIYPDITPLF